MLRRAPLHRIIIASLCASLVIPVFAYAVTSVGGRPARPREDEPRTKSIFVHTIQPGQTVTDALLLKNDSDSPQSVITYAVDAETTNTGAFTCAQKSEQAASAGAWITMGASEATLPPHTSQEVPFTITAPAKADVGEHNACIAIQPKDDDGELKGNMRIRTRSAVRVALTVPGALHRQVDISGFSARSRDNAQTYDVSVKNTGNVSADTRIDVTVYDLFGRQIHKDGGEFPVLREQTLDLGFKSQLTPLFGGFYHAHATISYGENAAAFSTGTNGSRVTKSSANSLIFIWPSVWVMLAILMTVCLVATILIRRGVLRRGRDAEFASWKNYRVKPGDTIASIAQTRHVSWKKLAKYNDIPEPYILNDRQTIKVPPREKK